MPTGARTTNRYGDEVQHSRAVADPSRTTVTPCSSCQCTVREDIRPVTVNGLVTAVMSAGEPIDTGASDSSSGLRPTGRRVRTPSTVAARAPS